MHGENLKLPGFILKICCENTRTRNVCNTLPSVLVELGRE